MKVWALLQTAYFPLIDSKGREVRDVEAEISSSIGRFASTSVPEDTRPDLQDFQASHIFSCGRGVASD